MRFRGAAVLVVLISMLMSVSLFAQEGAEGEEDPMMKAWMEYMTPGEGHAMMAKNVGKWKTTTKFWMMPGAEAQVSEGKAKAEMIMEGRYLKTKYEGMSWGMPFKGMSIQGYDNGKGEFETIWVDNMGTGITMAKGVYDADAEEYVMKGSYYDVMIKGPKEYTNKVRFDGDDKYVFEMWVKGPDGNEFKTMEMLHERVK